MEKKKNEREWKGIKEEESRIIREGVLEKKYNQDERRRGERQR